MRMIIKDYCRNMIICSKEKEGRGGWKSILAVQE